MINSFVFKVMPSSEKPLYHVKLADASTSFFGNLKKAQGDLANPEGGLTTTIGFLIQAALSLLGIILVIIIIYAGFQWMTAQGDTDKVKTAKRMIYQAVIGMAVIMAASTITWFVIGKLNI